MKKFDETALRQILQKFGSYLRIEVLLDWWKNMIKVLSCRFYKSLGAFNMLTVKECSEMVFFSEWSKQVFDSL